MDHIKLQLQEREEHLLGRRKELQTFINGHSLIVCCENGSDSSLQNCFCTA
jgi:hypothetical protein